MDDSIASKIYEVVSRIPRGKVTTYGTIASALGLSPRAVAAALKKNPRPLVVPCHRVVMHDGSLGGYSYGGPEVKRRLLEQEGVRFDANGKVLEEYIIRDPKQLLYR